MHPITIAQFASHRINELQSIADRIRQERALRAAPAVGPVVPPARPAEAQRSSATSGCASPAERAA